MESFVQRMRCVPRILGHRNGRAGRPLSDDDVKDVAQDVFILIWSKLPDFLGEASLETWAYHFCELTFLNRARDKQGRAASAASGDAGAYAVEDSFSNGYESMDTALVHWAIDRLSRNDAEIVRLRQFGELSFDEISESTRQPVNTVKSRYYRALSKLRELLLPRFQGREPT